MKEFTIVSSEEGQRLNKYLKRILPEASESFLCRMIRKKNIKVNDKAADVGTRLSCGDVVKIFFSDETYEKFAGSSSGADTSAYDNAFKTLKGIKIVYEDDDIVILYKPSGILAQRSSEKDLSINEYLIGYLLDKNVVSSSSLRSFRPSVINRLDRNTSGLIMCSKTLKGADELSLLIRERRIRKYYKAVCKGIISNESEMTAFLKKDEENNKVQVTDQYRNGYSKIITVIKPIKSYEDRTDIEVELITGKTHQIRAHLSHIGHPILGDTKYGDMSFNKKYGKYYQELCAYKLVFPDDCRIGSWNGLNVTI